MPSATQRLLLLLLLLLPLPLAAVLDAAWRCVTHGCSFFLVGGTGQDFGSKSVKSGGGCSETVKRRKSEGNESNDSVEGEGGKGPSLPHKGTWRGPSHTRMYTPGLVFVCFGCDSQHIRHPHATNKTPPRTCNLHDVDVGHPVTGHPGDTHPHSNRHHSFWRSPSRSIKTSSSRPQSVMTV